MDQKKILFIIGSSLIILTLMFCISLTNENTKQEVLIDTLQDKVKEYDTIIKEQNQIIDSQKAVIDEIKNTNEALNKYVEILEMKE